MNTIDDQDEEIQVLFDNVDKIVPHAQRGADREAEKGMHDDISMGVLTLAKAVQALRPAMTPTDECIPELDLETLNQTPAEGTLLLKLTENEYDLVLHMRLEGLASDKLINVLTSQPDLINHLREET